MQNIRMLSWTCRVADVKWCNGRMQCKRMFHSLHRHVSGANGSRTLRNHACADQSGSISRGIREESRTAADDSFLVRRDPLFSARLSGCRISRLILIPASRRWVCCHNDKRSWCVFFYLIRIRWYIAVCSARCFARCLASFISSPSRSSSPPPFLISHRARTRCKIVPVDDFNASVGKKSNEIEKLQPRHHFPVNGGILSHS